MGKTTGLESPEPGFKSCRHHLTALNYCYLILQTWLTQECWGASVTTGLEQASTGVDTGLPQWAQF